MLSTAAHVHITPQEAHAPAEGVSHGPDLRCSRSEAEQHLRWTQRHRTVEGWALARWGKLAKAAKQLITQRALRPSSAHLGSYAVAQGALLQHHWSAAVGKRASLQSMYRTKGLYIARRVGRKCGAAPPLPCNGRVAHGSTGSPCRCWLAGRCMRPMHQKCRPAAPHHLWQGRSRQCYLGAPCPRDNRHPPAQPAAGATVHKAKSVNRHVYKPTCALEQAGQQRHCALPACLRQQSDALGVEGQQRMSKGS